jgi:agmatine/peptidylarginine deiminase
MIDPKYPMKPTQVILYSDLQDVFDGKSIDDVIIWLEDFKVHNTDFNNVKFGLCEFADYHEIQIVGEVEESDAAYEIRVKKLKELENRQLNKDREQYEKLKLKFEGK